MNQLLKVGVALSALAALATSALAGPITGTWQGHIKINTSKAAVAPTPAQRSSMTRFEQATFALTIAPNHTFQIVTPGMPTRSGTWTQAGNTVTLQSVVNGKNMGDPEVFTLGKNEKVLSTTQKSPKNPDTIAITFSR